MLTVFLAFFLTGLLFTLSHHCGASHLSGAMCACGRGTFCQPRANSSCKHPVVTFYCDKITCLLQISADWCKSGSSDMRINP